MVSMQLKPKQPEKFNGKRDFQVIDNWITSVDSYFALTHAEPPDIYHYLNTIFTGEAATWFRFLYRNVEPNTVTWEAVRTSVKAYFVPPNYNRRLRDEWAYLRQTTTVSDYYARLTQLAMQLGEVEEERLVDKFVRGLKPKTRTEVELRDPQTLGEASRIADRFDTIVYRSPFVPLQSSHQEDTRGEPMQLDTLRTTPVQIDAFRTKTQSSKLRKLTNDERAHLRSINACFKCRKQGHMARECPSKTEHPNADHQ
jgi:Retrotransposon gag protein/Zinc knuckle